MFDRYTIHSGSVPSTVTKNVTVREIKAPTDESVRLLNEMQTKAMSNIIGRLHVNASGVEFRGFSYFDAQKGMNTVVFKYKLGTSEESVLKIDVPLHMKDPQELCNLLIDKLSRHLAVTLLTDYFDAELISHIVRK